MPWRELQKAITFTYQRKQITFTYFPDVWCFFSPAPGSTGYWNDLLGKMTKEQLARWDKEEFEQSLRDTFKGEVDDKKIKTFVQKWELKPIVKVNAQTNGRTNEGTLRLRL